MHEDPDQPRRQRGKPNLWILVGITALALALAVMVLVISALL